MIAAHPDDEVLGCGATAAKLSGQGVEITIAILGEGITSRSRDPKAEDQPMVQALRARAQQAGTLLGAREVVLKDFPDNRMDSVPLLDVVHCVEDLIERFAPDAIYTHHIGDLNVDHQVVHRAVLTATRPGTKTSVRDLYAFETASSTEWAFESLSRTFRPNVFVDVAETLEIKIVAMQSYESEKRAFPHPRSPECLRAIATRWGAVAGCGAAEAFELIRSLPR